MNSISNISTLSSFSPTKLVNRLVIPQNLSSGVVALIVFSTLALSALVVLAVHLIGNHCFYKRKVSRQSSKNRYNHIQNLLTPINGSHSSNSVLNYQSIPSSNPSSKNRDNYIQTNKQNLLTPINGSHSSNSIHNYQPIPSSNPHFDTPKYKKDDELKHLEDIEGKIEKLKSEIDKQGILAPASSVRDLEENLRQHAQAFRLYLEHRFHTRTQQGGTTFKDYENIEIQKQIILFSHFMGYTQNPAIILARLQEVDMFLANIFFNTPHVACIEEEKKFDAILFNEFFTIVNKYYSTIQGLNPQLATHLMIKLANLPINAERSNFAEIHLNPTRQLELLVAHFQNQENQNIDSIIQIFDHQNICFAKVDLERLSKFVNKGCSHLNDVNRIKLQNALTKRMGYQAPIDWENREGVLTHLTQFFPTVSRSSDYKKILNLYRSSKARDFFEKQKGLPENLMRIPYWYHATKSENVTPIIKSGQIKVLHQRAYLGAWVSTRRENALAGNCTFVFTDCITHTNHLFQQMKNQLNHTNDPEIFIGFEKGNEPGKPRWRGFNNPIDLKGPKVTHNQSISHLAYVGLSDSKSKNYKDYKNSIQIILHQQNLQVKVFKNSFVDYLQQEYLGLLGTPNLTLVHWGKADVEILDRPS